MVQTAKPRFFKLLQQNYHGLMNKVFLPGDELKFNDLDSYSFYLED